MKSFITVAALKQPTLEKKRVQMLPGGTLFLKTVFFKDMRDFQSTGYICGGFFTMAIWLHLNRAEVLVVVLVTISCGRQEEALVLKGSKYCLLVLSSAKHEPQTLH